MKFIIEPGGRKQVELEHRFLLVIYASDVFEIEVAGKPAFELRNKQRIDLMEPRRAQLINRKTEVLEVELQTSAFEIKEQDSVTIAPGSQVSIAPGSSIDVGTVQIADDADILIRDGSQVGVNNFPDTQNVEGKVVVSELPAVVVSELPAVSIADKVVEDTSGQVIGLDKIECTPQVKTIAGNSNRKLIEIKAALANSGNIWIGGDAAGRGIPLGMGEAYSGKITADIQIFAEVAGDEVYLMEVMGV